MDKAAIIIVHYKNEKDTLECLNSIFINHSSNKKIQVIVVINPPYVSESVGKNDSFKTILRKKYPQVIVIENNTNTGFAQANNIGIQKALDLECEYILLLNNDTIVSLELLDKLIKYAKSDSKVGVMSPKIYFAKGFEYHKDRYKDKEKGKVIWYAGGKIDWANVYASHKGVDEVDVGQYGETCETDFATGCCMLITRKTIDKIGLFDSKYFLYYEDVDYSVRVKNNNMKVIYFPKVVLWHKNASSSGKPGSKMHIYYQNRNRLYFGFKYATSKTKKSLFWDSLRLLIKGGVYTKSTMDYHLGRLGKASI